MDVSYLYSYNAPRYRKMAERNLPCRDELNTLEVESGYLLPNRYAANRLFGHGGVLDAEQNFVKESEMNAYAKYAAEADVHSEDKLRVNCVVVNCEEFYKAFGITEKDGMWVAPEDRIEIW